MHKGNKACLEFLAIIAEDKLKHWEVIRWRMNVANFCKLNYST